MIARAITTSSQILRVTPRTTAIKLAHKTGPTIVPSSVKKNHLYSTFASPSSSKLFHHCARVCQLDKPAAAADESDIVSVTFVNTDGKRATVRTETGKTLYDAVIDNNVDIDGFGACGGTLCCTTCHLILKQSDYDKIPQPSDEETDMLDLAFDLSDTSRLGCQVKIIKELHPLEVQVPASSCDAREG